MFGINEITKSETIAIDQDLTESSLSECRSIKLILHFNA